MRGRPAGVRAVLMKTAGNPAVVGCRPAQAAAGIAQNLQHQPREARRQQAYQRGAVYTRRKPNRDTTFPCGSFRPFIAPGHNADGGKVGKRHQEHGENAEPARGHLMAIFAAQSSPQIH